MPDRKWLFDTVALSNFMLAEALFLLEKRYHGKGLISDEVYTELASGFVAYPELRRIDVLLEKKIFRLTGLTPKERNSYQKLISHLGKGESSCIAIAENRKSITLVTDDRAARTQCMLLKIPMTGTIGILKASVAAGVLSLSKADDILHTMILNGFYSPVRHLADIT